MGTVDSCRGKAAPLDRFRAGAIACGVTFTFGVVAAVATSSDPDASAVERAALVASDPAGTPSRGTGTGDASDGSAEGPAAPPASPAAPSTDGSPVSGSPGTTAPPGAPDGDATTEPGPASGPGPEAGEPSADLPVALPPAVAGLVEEVVAGNEDTLAFLAFLLWGMTESQLDQLDGHLRRIDTTTRALLVEQLRDAAEAEHLPDAARLLLHTGADAVEDSLLPSGPAGPTDAEETTPPTSTATDLADGPIDSLVPGDPTDGLVDPPAVPDLPPAPDLPDVPEADDPLDDLVDGLFG